MGYVRVVLLGCAGLLAIAIFMALVVLVIFQTPSRVHVRLVPVTVHRTTPDSGPGP